MPWREWFSHHPRMAAVTTYLMMAGIGVVAIVAVLIVLWLLTFTAPIDPSNPVVP
jgi:hypothetical protein